MLVNISFKNYSAVVDTLGAQLRSLKKCGNEILWQGDEKYWNGTAPILFPICGGLKDDSCIINGNRYYIDKHGFASKLEFVPCKIAENSVSMTLTSCADTLKKYPFQFELKAIFTLTEEGLVTDYIVKNNNSFDMFYSIGSHEGYYCEGGFENYDLIFNKIERFEVCELDGSILSHNKQKILPDGDKLSLKNEYFEIDALIFESPNSDEVSLVNRNTKQTITVGFKDFKNLLVWTIPNASFICIEPWNGFPDYSDTDGDFTKKNSIIKIKPLGVSKNTHTIKF